MIPKSAESAWVREARMTPVHAGVRFLGVTVSWYTWFKWRG